jgi:hypothetical protein
MAVDSIYIALQGLYKGKVNNFYIVTNSSVKIRLNKVSSSQNYI